MISGTQGQDQVIEPEKKKISTYMVFALLLVLLVSYLAAPVFSQWSASTAKVNKQDLIIATVIKGDLIRDVAVNGKIVAANSPLLYSTEKGQVTLLAKPGEQVTSGQPIARVESPELSALIKQAESVLAQLKIDAKRGELVDKESQLNLESSVNAALSEFNIAKREYERAQLSFNKQVMSKVDWLKSQDRVEDAKRAYEHAQKRIALAKERLVFESQNRQFEVQRQALVVDELVRREQALTIKAPVSGIVGNWLVAQKNTIAASTAVMSIIDLSEYEAEIYVPEFYADDLGIGLTVSMKLGNEPVTGEIIAVSPEIKNNQVQVRAKLFNINSQQLRQNQRLNARIEFEKKENVLMVKKGAFLGSLGGKFAYKLEQAGLAKQVTIATGSSSVEFIELLSGVKEGDELIISDYEKYQDAKQVRIN